MSRSFGKGGLLVVGIVVLAIGLSACGRRGPLEDPPAYSALPAAPAVTGAG